MVGEILPHWTHRYPMTMSGQARLVGIYFLLCRAIRSLAGNLTSRGRGSKRLIDSQWLGCVISPHVFDNEWQNWTWIAEC